MGALSFAGDVVNKAASGITTAVSKLFGGSAPVAEKSTKITAKSSSQASMQTSAKQNYQATTAKKVNTQPEYGEAVKLPLEADATETLSGLSKAQNSVTGISKSKALAGAGLTAAGAAMATAALVQATTSTQNPSGSDAMHTDPSGGDSQTLPNPYDPSEYYAYGYQQGVTDADNEWSNWFNSLFGGAEEQAQQIFEPFEEIPLVGDAVEEVRSKGLALPALIGVIIVLAVGGHLIRKKLRRSGHGKAGRHHKRR